jgi:hypothetical protein
MLTKTKEYSPADKGNFLQIAAVCLSLSKYSMASYYLDLANEF